MKKFCLYIFSVLICTVAYAEPVRNITWEPVPGAWGYALEIQNSAGNIILSKEVRDNYFPVSQFEPGDYSFRIATINLLKQKGDSTGWIKFSIEKLYVPQLSTVSKRQLISTYNNKNIIITGSNFRTESRLHLRGNGKDVEISDVKIISGGEAEFSYNPSSSLKGVYDLVIINRGDAEAILKNSIEIVEPAEAERFYFISAGYSVSVPNGIWGDYFAPSFTGGKFSFQFSFKNPFLENFLIGTDIEAVQYKNKDTRNKSSLLYSSFGLGAGYYFPITAINTEIFIKFSGGPVYTVLTLDQNVVGKTTTTVDWFASAGAGLRIYIGGSFFIEPAGSWKTIFYKGGSLGEAGGSLCAGFRI